MTETYFLVLIVCVAACFFAGVHGFNRGYSA